MTEHMLSGESQSEAGGGTLLGKQRRSGVQQWLLPLLYHTASIFACLFSACMLACWCLGTNTPLPCPSLARLLVWWCYDTNNTASIFACFVFQHAACILCARWSCSRWQCTRPPFGIGTEWWSGYAFLSNLGFGCRSSPSSPLHACDRRSVPVLNGGRVGLSEMLDHRCHPVGVGTNIM